MMKLSCEATANRVQRNKISGALGSNDVTLISKSKTTIQKLKKVLDQHLNKISQLETQTWNY